jgi:sarcosine oxidase subunit alpha
MESGNERSLRIDSNVERGRPVRITVDGEAIPAYEGESVAAAMMASGRRVFRHAEPAPQQAKNGLAGDPAHAPQQAKDGLAGDPAHGGGPRGIFCGMGICNECMVTVAEVGHVRACIATVRDGMRVSTAGE